MNATPTPHLVIENFLSATDRDRLLDFVLDDDRFAPALITAPGAHQGAANDTFRRASVTNPDDEIFAVIEEKLQALLPHVRRELGIPYFKNNGRLERQVTAHRDGDFFTKHTDTGDPWSEASSRRIAYVYYFHDHPKAFEGGELRLFDHAVSPDGPQDEDQASATVDPADNSVVFFRTDVLHEVTPVKATGDPTAPGATRYTVNGWFHDPEAPRADPPLDPPVMLALTERYTPSFTEHGFEKVKTPAAIHRALRAVYDERIGSSTTEAIGELYLPTGTPDFLYIDDVKAQFQLALQQMHEDWSGVELLPTAAYGLRVYRQGQTLIPHTDILSTHVISSIVHIAHETEEPWPLWIRDLHGNEHHVVLEEGEMLLYESARCPHARPEPLQGSAYCSLFLHYRPLDWDLTYAKLVDQAIAAGDRDTLPADFWPDAEPALTAADAIADE